MAKNWYVVHVYSGFEKKIAQQITEQAAQKGLADQFEAVLVPSENVVEVKRGRKINSEHKFFPGYVLVKMDLTDDAWHLVKNTPKVTGFLGSKTKPDQRGGGGPDLEAEPGGGGSASSGGAVRDRRAGARGGRSVHQLQRHGRRSGRGEGALEGVRVDLWSFDAGGTGILPGGEAVGGWAGPYPASRHDGHERRLSCRKRSYPAWIYCHRHSAGRGTNVRLCRQNSSCRAR
jgi:Transcription termination factor nusG